MKKHIRLFVIFLIIISVSLACEVSSGNTNSNPDLVNTQVAMALTLTAMSNVPADSNPPPQVLPQDTATREKVMPTDTPEPPTPQDIQSLIDSSNILIYEEIAGYPEYITYVARALKSVGGHHVYVGDAMGTFLEKLNSGTKWDLIIVAAEARKAISGDYWTAIKTKVDDGAGLVAETWYLNRINGGKIGPFLNECGVEVQADWQKQVGDNRVNFGIYWTEPDSLVFNKPNQVSSFAASLTSPAWYGDIGDFLTIRDNSNARILASHSPGQNQNYGLITECMNGRVILQTFDSHDYPTDGMVALWQNYIIYTLTNHFTGNR
jgi:hypothetical protein